jgi:hypothetical protein
MSSEVMAGKILTLPYIYWLRWRPPIDRITAMPYCLGRMLSSDSLGEKRNISF